MDIVDILGFLTFTVQCGQFMVPYITVLTVLMELIIISLIG